MQMETSFSYIEENIKRILDNIEEAKAKYRKNDEKIELIGVTKTVAPEAVNYAVSCGIKLLGENKVQEYLSKKDLYYKEADIHFIGHLQTNKVKNIISDMKLIQSVDSIKLASEINRQAERVNKVQDILIEVNIGNEESKSGIKPDTLGELLSELTSMRNIKVNGLMSIPPAGCSEEYFYRMQQLYIDISAKNVDNINMNVLSMGMSGDYQTSIKYGATMVRIGSALFGARSYK